MSSNEGRYRPWWIKINIVLNKNNYYYEEKYCIIYSIWYYIGNCAKIKLNSACLQQFCYYIFQVNGSLHPKMLSTIFCWVRLIGTNHSPKKSHWYEIFLTKNEVLVISCIGIALLQKMMFFTYLTLISSALSSKISVSQVPSKMLHHCKKEFPMSVVLV